MDCELLLLYRAAAAPVALGLHHLFQDLDLKGIENRFFVVVVFVCVFVFVKCTRSMEPILLLFFISNFLCTQNSLLFLLTLQIKPDIS